jgi:hypothetical protein
MPRLVTYNMQGGGNWTNVGPMLTGTYVPNPSNPYQPVHLKADVVCLQECGSPPTGHQQQGQVVDANQNVSKLTSHDRTLYWVDWGAGNNRCSLGVATRHTVLKYRVIPVNANANLRPVLGLKIAFPGNGNATENIWVYSCHMPSGNHNFASACAYDTIANGNFTGSWILAGDFNCSPTEYANPPGNLRSWGNKPEGVPVHSDGATHQGGGNLDYAVSPDVTLNFTVRHGLSSDHCAVWFSF